MIVKVLYRGGLLRRAVPVVALALTIFGSGLSLQAATSYSAAPPPRSRMYAFESALEQWDTSAASRLLEAARKSYGENDETVRFMNARLNFFEGRYDEAAALIDALGLTEDSEGSYGSFISILKAAQRQVGAMKTFTSEHFIYHVPAGKDEVLIPFIQETAEQAFAALQQDLGGNDETLGVPLRIEIYPDIRGFSQISSLTLKEIKTSGTVALCKYNRLMITSPRTLARGYRWRDTLNHEMVHYFLSRLTSNRLPLWLHEGIARFEERRWRTTLVGEMNVLEQSILFEARQRNYWVPLSAMEPSLAKLPNSGDTGLAFAELHGMVRLLYEKGGYPLIREILDLFRQGASTASVLQKIGEQSPAVLFSRLQKDLQQRRLEHLAGRRILPLAEGESDAPDSWGEISAKARQRIHLGDLMRDRGRFKGAEEEYLLAAAEIPGKDPTVAAKLGETRVLAGQYDKAWQDLKPLLVMYDGDPRIYFAAAKAAYFRKDLKAAEGLLESTVGIHPFQPELFRLLADARERLGDKEGAKLARQSESFLMQTADDAAH